LSAPTVKKFTDTQTRFHDLFILTEFLPNETNKYGNCTQAFIYSLQQSMEVNDQFHAAAALPPENIAPRCQVKMRLSSAARLDKLADRIYFANAKNQTTNPRFSLHYTDRATPVYRTPEYKVQSPPTT
jgi:hypothetical protein